MLIKDHGLQVDRGSVDMEAKCGVNLSTDHEDHELSRANPQTPSSPHGGVWT